MPNMIVQRFVAYLFIGHFNVFVFFIVIYCLCWLLVLLFNPPWKNITFAREILRLMYDFVNTTQYIFAYAYVGVSDGRLFVSVP